VFENRLLRKIGSKRDEVTGDWRTLHNEEKVKVTAVCGSYSTAALRHIVLLPE